MNEELCEQFKQGNLDVHCETEDECKAFVKMCFEAGYKWSTKPYTYTYWDRYKDTIHYHIGFGRLRVQSSSSCGRTITYKDLMNINYALPPELDIFSYLKEGFENGK